MADDSAGGQHAAAPGDEKIAAAFQAIAARRHVIALPELEPGAPRGTMLFLEPEADGPGLFVAIARFDDRRDPPLDFLRVNVATPAAPDLAAMVEPILGTRDEKAALDLLSPYLAALARVALQAVRQGAVPQPGWKLFAGGRGGLLESDVTPDRHGPWALAVRTFVRAASAGDASLTGLARRADIAVLVRDGLSDRVVEVG